MSKRILITIGIILTIGVGTGTLIIGLMLVNTPGWNGQDYDNASFVAVGGGILAAGIAALIAHLNGAFRSLDDPDDDRP